MNTNNQYPVLSIIIVNYNVKEHILNCIQSIQDKINANICNYEVIVSDNGSVDGSIEAIRERFPWVKIIENNANFGFGKANNVGAKQSQGEVLFFLNPDALIVQGIEGMVQYLIKNKEIGIINPLIVDEHYEFENSYENYKMSSYLTFQFIYLIYPKPFCIKWNKTHIKNVKKLAVFKIERFYGCAFLIRKQLFEDIGLFDENIFLYFEEEDVTFRLMKLNHLCYCYPKSQIIHIGMRINASQNKYGFTVCNKRTLVSKKYLLRKYFPYTWVLRYLLDIGIIVRILITSMIKILIKKEPKDYAMVKNYFVSIKLAFLTLMNK